MIWTNLPNQLISLLEFAGKFISQLVESISDKLVVIKPSANASATGTREGVKNLGFSDHNAGLPSKAKLGECSFCPIRT